MSAPKVSVGIMPSAGPKLTFTLTGIYSTHDVDVVTGRQVVSLTDSGLALKWNGITATSIEFAPTSPHGDWFEIEGVTIGVKFHWERRETQRFRGTLRVLADGGKLVVINVIDVEEYLKSVISSEMSSTASPALLKAHAIISRSWLLAQIENRGPRCVAESTAVANDKEITRWWDHDDHRLFDVCADDHCQRYQGITRIATENARSAVDDTRGRVLTYGGTLCDARFSKCCGGVMEQFENCWENSPKPYLRARRDDIAATDFPDLTIENEAEKWILSSPRAFCNTADSHILSQVMNGYDCETTDFYRWRVQLSREKIRTLVAERLGRDLGDILELLPLARGTSGRIFRLQIIGTEGEIIIGKELMIRRVLSDSHLLSSAFTVETVAAPDGGDIPSAFVLRGAGWGHGVGLCQIGAAIMGARGYSHESILNHYYPGAEITRLYE